jgi:hypothetical protein
LINKEKEKMSIEKSTMELVSSESFTHIITTDNIYFNQIGLGSFTTGVLYEYWNARDANGKYLNREVIRNSGNEEIKTIAEMFGSPPLGADENYGSWQGWRPKEDTPTGRYVLQSYRDFEKKVQNNGIRRDEDFNLSDFIVTESGIPNLATSGLISDKDGYYAGIERSPVAVHPTIYNGIKPGITAPLGFLERYKEDVGFFTNTPCPIVNLINLNDYMNDLKKQSNVSDWEDGFSEDEEKEDENQLNTLSGDELISLDTMVQDSKYSKFRTIAFSGVITFNMKFAGEKFVCPITEIVTFKLKLYDQPMELLSRPTPVPKSNYIADFRTDAFGRKMQSKEDGDVSPIGDTADANKTMAGWNLSYNEYLNKWETGTKQVMAKCMQDIGPASAPNVSTLETYVVKDALESDADSSKFVPATGYCMPIFMQNGNPFQWSPNYQKAKDCRDEDLVKHKVRGFNFATNRSYKKDQMVHLTQIDGIWQLSPLDKSDDAVSLSQPKQWQFQYFLTTRKDYFKGLDAEGLSDGVTPIDAERIAHKSYYQGDPKQVDIEYNSQFSSKGYADVAGFKKVDASFQISSFDFMDSKIFGSRVDGNMLGTSNF